MFTSIKNNFGAGEITFTDYQDEKVVVLNAKISFDPHNADFEAADVLKVTVPELSIPRSGIAACTIMARFDGQTGYKNVTPHGTFIKTWIENPTTVCIEKLDVPEWFETASEYIIYLYSLYVPKGKRTTITPEKKSATITFTLKNEQNGTKWGNAYIEDGWVMIELTQSGYYYPPSDGSLDEITISDGFPNDVYLEIPFFSSEPNVYKPGAKMHKALIHGNKISALETFGYLISSNGDDFIHAFAVRGTYDPELDDGAGAGTTEEETETTE